MFFLHKKPLTRRNLYTHTAHWNFYRPIFLHLDTLPRTIFTQQKLFRTDAFTILYAPKNYAQQFLQTDGFYTHKIFRTEVLRTEGFTHNFFYTDVFTHTCLYTGTNCTQKLVRTYCIYTQPTFTQRGFASPSWSPYLSCSPSQVSCLDPLVKVFKNFVKYWDVSAWIISNSIAGRGQTSTRWASSRAQVGLHTCTGLVISGDGNFKCAVSIC